MNAKKNIAVFLLVMLLVIGSYYFLDARIALGVKTIWASNARLRIFSITIPDILFPIVCIVTGIAWTAYFILVHKGIYNVHTRFFLLVAGAVPVAFFFKSVLKFIVGRINTRFWLLHLRHEHFHWFHGKGNYSSFPSGHMAVFTVLAAALWHFYPRYRIVNLGFLTALALALILTNYHFLSDIIAGAYLGLIVHVIMLQTIRLLRRDQQHEGIVERNESL
jgi:membrane-associated phospholipid phosphatase